MNKSVFIAGIFVFISGCSFINIFDDGHGLCRAIGDDEPARMYRSAERELKKESPNSYLTQPYSRENWDAHWNHRIFYMWDLGPDSCGGTYRGLSGPDLIRLMAKKRRELGLPEITLEDRNRDKEL